MDDDNDNDKIDYFTPCGCVEGNNNTRYLCHCLQSGQVPNYGAFTLVGYPIGFVMWKDCIGMHYYVFSTHNRNIK